MVLACISLVAALGYLLLFIGSDGFDSENQPGLAYWCWTASMVVAVIGSGLDLIPARTRAADGPSREYDEPAVSSIPRDPGIQK
jgi:hypothetical protein